MKIRYALNENGPKLGFSDESGVTIIEKDGLLFKDHSRTGELLPYEDWRLPAEERTRDLLSRLSLRELAGLMLHKLLREGDRLEYTPELEESYIHGYAYMSIGAERDLSLICGISNEVQAQMERLPHAIPALMTAEGINECRDGGPGSPIFSSWPVPLGIAATFDPENARKWGETTSREYRASGVTVALEPQADIATEPRWNRFFQTFGESPELTADMARAFIDGLQTSSGDREIENGWGRESVCATAKHFPGGGPCEAGRDAHFNFGKYAVYPGNNFEEHLRPFTEGAMKLSGPTGSTAFIMPYYTISYGRDNVNGENVGNGYSDYILRNLLRERLGFSGGIFSDFGITRDIARGSFFAGKGWGVEEYTAEAKHLKSVLAGMCIFGADENYRALNSAIDVAVMRYGEERTRELLCDRVYYRLLYSFRQGMFENPYLDIDESREEIRSAGAAGQGYDVQRKSVIMLKNSKNALPVSGRKKVYIPPRRRSGSRDRIDLKFATQTKGEDGEMVFLPVDARVVSRYFDLTDDPGDADFAIVFIEEPDTGYGWSEEDLASGGNGYLPVSLQYRPYRAVSAREVSIAGGDYFEGFTNRSYKDKTVTAYNESDLDAVLETRRAMGGRPVIVSLILSRPVVVGELEPAADAILVHSGIETSAILDIISGAFEPSGLLPMQMPADMETVEKQLEDVPFDMECYVDSEGRTYDFGYGLNWSGVISDERTARYKRKREVKE